MPLHYTKKKAAVKLYATKTWDAPDEFFEAVKAEYPEVTAEELSEILNSALSPTINDAVSAVNGMSMPPGKKLYDKWRGQWNATKTERVPGSKDVLYSEWTFERLETKANKTGIPLSEREYRIFNDTHFMPLGKVPTEQLYLTGDNAPIIFKLDSTGDRYNQI